MLCGNCSNMPANVTACTGIHITVDGSTTCTPAHAYVCPIAAARRRSAQSWRDHREVGQAHHSEHGGRQSGGSRCSGIWPWCAGGVLESWSCRRHCAPNPALAASAWPQACSPSRAAVLCASDANKRLRSSTAPGTALMVMRPRCCTSTAANHACCALHGMCLCAYGRGSCAPCRSQGDTCRAGASSRRTLHARACHKCRGCLQSQQQAVQH